MTYYGKIINLYNYSIINFPKINNKCFINQEIRLDTDGYEYLRLLYVKDLWVTEVSTSVPEGCTEDILIDYVENKNSTSLTFIEKQTIDNLFDTVDKYITPDRKTSDKLSVDLIKSIHISLMKNLLVIDDVVTFRKKMCLLKTQIWNICHTM